MQSDTCLEDLYSAEPTSGLDNEMTHRSLFLRSCLISKYEKLNSIRIIMAGLAKGRVNLLNCEIAKTDTASFDFETLELKLIGKFSCQVTSLK